ncbi:MAG: hypothetical protein IPQ13_07620 [Holophagaceae bacterium]|nr:hypothetical protein [Holophagaceae bacterium]
MTTKEASSPKPATRPVAAIADHSLPSPNPRLLSSGFMIGENTGRKIEAFLSRIPGEAGLFKPNQEELLQAVVNELLQNQWADDQAVIALDACIDELTANKTLNTQSLGSWLRRHRNDPEAVIDCLTLDPPVELDLVYERLPKTGSQKQVFLARWKSSQRRVVLKRVMGSTEVRDLIGEREGKSHPLSLEGPHPNIVASYPLRNSAGEPFLVEKEVLVLNDGWKADGYQEAANALHDLASALAFIHHDGLVHGDIKPDNIGRDGCYVLLDFGICRRVKDFLPESTPTGSLRTRPPELLTKTSIDNPQAIDIWALAATMFKGLTGRFPLITEREPIPRVSDAVNRIAFEKELAHRVTDEWDKWVRVDLIPLPFQQVLMPALERSAAKRPSAAEFLTSVNAHLSAYLPSRSESGSFSPIEALRQILLYLPDPQSLALAPQSRKEALKKKIDQIERVEGLDEAQQRSLTELKRALLGVAV